MRAHSYMHALLYSKVHIYKRLEFWGARPVLAEIGGAIAPSSPLLRRPCKSSTTQTIELSN